MDAPSGSSSIAHTAARIIPSSVISKNSTHRLRAYLTDQVQIAHSKLLSRQVIPAACFASIIILINVPKLEIDRHHRRTLFAHTLRLQLCVISCKLQSGNRSVFISPSAGMIPVSLLIQISRTRLLYCSGHDFMVNTYLKKAYLGRLVIGNRDEPDHQLCQLP
jgi:hypothetical protein